MNLTVRAETPQSYAARHRHTATAGVARLLSGVLAPPPVAATHTVVAADGELYEFLEQAETFDLPQLAGDSPTRQEVRYLAALFAPEVGFSALADRIHYLLNSKHLSVDEVAWVLVGHEREVPVETIQTIGARLRDGAKLTDIAAESGVSVKTVQRIDTLCGIRAARDQDRLDTAIEAAREGTSVRKLAAHLGVGRDTAHTLLTRARAVLTELGELPTHPTPKENHR